MREYLLYIKTGHDSVQLYVTPCFQVDQAFWQEREGCQLYVMGRTPSLALAFSVRERLNRSLQEERMAKRPMNEHVLEQLRRLALSCVRETSSLYGRDMAEKGSLRESWFSWGDGVKREAVEIVDSCVNLEQEVKNLLAGRALLWEEMEMLIRKQDLCIPDLDRILQRMVLAGEAAWLPGVQLFVKNSWLRHSLKLKCSRCGSEGEQIEQTICHTCGQGCAYCTVCLGMGRSKCCTPYLLVPASASSAAQHRNVSRLAWSGRYSKDQSLAAERARRFVANPWTRAREFLIWAVCGAGKTELLFPSVAEALSRGGRVLIATPRKDVVLELAPRIQKVFPEAKVIAVHGSSKEKWADSDIAIATTHQVMRYFQRFFLVVLDEVDAFPYHNNPVLYQALSRAVQPRGKILYLSATPPRYLQKKLVSKRRSLDGKVSYDLYSLTHVLLPGRYHGHELPVPQILTVQGLSKHVKAGRVISPLIEMVRDSIAADRQVFLFVPRIEEVESILAYMQSSLPEHAGTMAGVHAADPMREEKVLAFREKAIKLMVTTTILERGVTIRGSNVVVVGAQAPVFDEASLVQIAGRVGRSPDDPKGTVLFLQAYRAQAPQAAVRQITQMNRLAKRLSSREC